MENWAGRGWKERERKKERGRQKGSQKGKCAKAFFKLRLRVTRTLYR